MLKAKSNAVTERTIGNHGKTEAKAYETLSRAAASEAEEAIKRGEIPRQYRGYIRRYFDESEGK